MAKVNIIYWSGSGNTEAMAKLIAEGAKEKGAEVKVINVADAAETDITEADAVALGSPAMGSEVIEEGEMEPFVESIASLVSGRKLGLFGSYGWGDGEWMRNWAARMSDCGAIVVGDGLIVNEAPEGSAQDECRKYGAQMAE